MKTVYIPKGETVSYETLSTENLVVKGCLVIEGSLKAKHISGSGVIHAGSISADHIKMNELESAMIACQRLIASRVSAAEIHASESMAVSCYLEAELVETGRLTVCMTQVSEVVAAEVINLPTKKRSLLGTLLSSAFRSFWLSRRMPRHGAEVQDAEYTVASEETAAPAQAEDKEQPEAETVNTDIPADDFELKRMIAQFKLLRDSGYTLKIIPGTPEENAPEEFAIPFQRAA